MFLPAEILLLSCLSFFQLLSFSFLFFCMFHFLKSIFLSIFNFTFNLFYF